MVRFLCLTLSTVKSSDLLAHLESEEPILPGVFEVSSDGIAWDTTNSKSEPALDSGSLPVLPAENLSTGSKSEANISSSYLQPTAQPEQLLTESDTMAESEDDMVLPSSPTSIPSSKLEQVLKSTN